MRKKMIAVLLAVVLVMGLTPVAFADGGVSLSVTSVSPESLSGDGNVTIKLAVSVPANAPSAATDITVIYNGEPLSSFDEEVAPGSTATDTVTFYMSASQLDQAQKLSMQWTWADDAEPQSVSNAASFTVKKKAEAVKPKVEFSRSISKKSVKKGDSVVITYKVKNTGTVAISNLAIKDFGSSVNQRSSLAAGETWEVPYTLTVSETTTSTPTLSFTADGKTYTSTLDSSTIQAGESKVGISLSASTTRANVGDSVTLTCKVTNQGSLDIASYTISDPKLGQLYSGGALKAGQSKTFTKKVTMSETASYTFTVNAKDSSGATVKATSSTVEVEVQKTAGDINAEIQAETDTKKLAAPGEVEFVITVFNLGKDPLTNLTITDQDGNVVQKIDRLPTGNQQIRHKVKVEETTDYTFILSVAAEDGVTRRVTSGAVRVEVGEGATPEASPTPGASPSPSPTPAPSSGMSIVTKIFLVLGILALLIVAAVVGIIYFIRQDKKRGGGDNRRGPKGGQGGRKGGRADRPDGPRDPGRPGRGVQLDEEPEEDASAEDILAGLGLDDPLPQTTEYPDDGPTAYYVRPDGQQVDDATQIFRPEDLAAEPPRDEDFDATRAFRPLDDTSWTQSGWQEGSQDRPGGWDPTQDSGSPSEDDWKR